MTAAELHERAMCAAFAREETARRSGRGPGWLPQDELTASWLGYVEDYRRESAARESGSGPECRECDRLRAENAALRAQVRELVREVVEGEGD